ncbi:MAG: VIT domain-containing protein, partial [Planctomycetaceae bacterium]
MTTNEPNNKNLQQAITDSLAPAALSDMSDADIEQLLNDAAAKPISADAIARILKQSNPAHPSDRTIQLPRGVHSPGDRPGSSKEIAMSMSNPNRASISARQRGSVAALLVSALCLLIVVAVPTRPRTKPTDRPPITFGAAAADVWRTQPLIPEVTAAIQRYAKVAVGEIVETKERERRRFSLPDGSVLFMNENTTVKLESLRQLSVTDGEVFVEVCPQFDDQNNRQFFYVNTPNRKLTAIGTKFAVKAAEKDTELLVTQGKVKADGVDETIAAGRFVRFKENEVKLSMAPRASEALNWTEDLMVAAPIVPRSKYCGGALISMDPNGQEMNLRLRNYHVDVHIEDGFARTTIDQTYFNQTHSRLEGKFKFPLPADASLSRLAMYVGPKLMEGGMAERDHARNTFEQ